MKIVAATAIVSLSLIGCKTTPTPAPSAETAPTPPKAKPAEKAEAPAVPIHQAAYKGSVDIIQQPLAAGTPIDTTNQYGSTPLHLAAHNETC